MAKKTPLPDESKPGYYSVSGRGDSRWTDDAYKKVTDALTKPRSLITAETGEQAYTTQEYKESQEKQTATLMGTPTKAGDRTVNAANIGGVSLLEQLR
jgi:hypothetical protein